MKLNIGCGYNKHDGFINIDKDKNCNPDLVLDISKDKLPFEDNSVDIVLATHVLEHIGEGYFHLIKEIYRVCKNGSQFVVAVPHPRHDNFFGDPTHVRVIVPEQFRLMNKELNDQWIAEGWANSCLGHYLNVNYEIKNLEYMPDDQYKHLSEKELYKIHKMYNNVISEYRMIIEVIK